LLRSRWTAFIGFRVGIVVDCLKDVHDGLGFEYDIVKKSPAFKDSFIYGSREDTVVFEVRSPADMNTKVSDVTADPLFRGLYSFITSRENFKELTEDISLISIYPITKTTRPLVGALIKKLASRLPEKPWHLLKKHPRFRASPLLHLRVKRQWEQWLASPQGSNGVSELPR